MARVVRESDTEVWVIQPETAAETMSFTASDLCEIMNELGPEYVIIYDAQITPQFLSKVVVKHKPRLVYFH